MKTRRRSTWLTFPVAGLAVAALAQAPRVPVPAIKTSLGSMPGIDELSSRPALPDVLIFENGDRVTSPAQWPKRREEMKRTLAYYATGRMPPAPGNVQGRDIASADMLRGTVHYRLVHLSFGPDSKYGFDVALFIPASARGPAPVVIFPAFGPTPGGTPLPTMARPPEQGKGIDALTVPLGDQAARAAAAAAVAKSGAPAAPPPGLAALSDPETAAAAPAGSGAGGTGAYRFNGARGGGREGLADMMRKYPNWFSPNLYQFAADVDRLPFDQHWLIALAAPRAFISLEGTEDQNCVPNALKQAVVGARAAFELLGAPKRLGVHYAPHRHALAAEDWDALLGFADQQLFGRSVARRFDQFPDTVR